jgi:hypothetical protein
LRRWQDVGEAGDRQAGGKKFEGGAAVVFNGGMLTLAHITATEIGVIGAVFVAGFLAARLAVPRRWSFRESRPKPPGAT